MPIVVDHRGRTAALWLFVYLAVKRMVELVVLCFRSSDAKEVEILVLRPEP